MHDQLPLAWSCSEESIMQLLRARDPSKCGVSDRLALRLLLQLLHWSPHSRPKPQQILLHAYFTQDKTDFSACHNIRDLSGWC